MVISKEEVAKAVALVEDGHSVRNVAKCLGIPRSTIHGAVTRHRETGKYSRKPGSGRGRLTTCFDVTFLTMSLMQNRSLTVKELRNNLLEQRGISVSTQTIRRRLHEAGLTYRKPLKIPELSKEHRNKRLSFAKQYFHWSEEKWKTVLFTGIATFELYDTDRPVWRKENEHIKEYSERQSVTVWGGINFEATTELIEIENSTITPAKYIEEILLEAVVPFAPFVGDKFLLMHDNYNLETTKTVCQFLQDVRINVIDWPERSPDINPMESLWGMLRRCIKNREHPPTNVEQLREVLYEEWDILSQENIQNLIRAVPRRLRAVRLSHGGNTKEEVD